MKWFVLIFSLMALYSCGEKKQDGFSVSGKIIGGAGQTIYLDIVNETQVEKFDSAIIGEDDFFMIRNKTANPELFVLKLADMNFIYLIIDSADQIKINAETGNLLTSCSIEGSGNSEIIRKTSLHNYNTRLRVDSISKIYNSQKTLVNPDSLRRSLDSVYLKIYTDERNYLIDIIEKNPNSLASIMALFQQIVPKTFVLNPENPMDMKYFEMLDTNLGKSYPNSVHVKSLHSQLIEVKKRVNAMKTMDQAMQGGSAAPEIAEADPEGNIIKLSSLRGKYVLLDFWASWCAPCRQENPNVVANYTKYKSKGFEIYAVSLDKDKAAWIKAIEADKLNWIHVSDLKFWSSYPAMQYKVQSIPANFLIDPEGKIIAQNLRGSALGAKLSEIFDK